MYVVGSLLFILGDGSYDQEYFHIGNIVSCKKRLRLGQVSIVDTHPFDQLYWYHLHLQPDWYLQYQY